MSTNKYADLPDIDTAPDIYETEDVEASAEDAEGDESDEETQQTQRTARGRQEPSKEEIDSSNLIDTEKATKHFRRAERRYDRTAYTLSSSPTRSHSPSRSSGNTRRLSLSQRLRLLQTELLSLESELADPSNPQLVKEREEENVDPGELIRGVVDVRARLDKIRKDKEGRGKLVGVILEEQHEEEDEAEDTDEKEKETEKVPTEEKSETRTVADMDKRVGELEKIVGSASTALDETSLLPPPLLPLIPRLNAQLNLLTQPRHIDSISRRLKLLVTELDRTTAQQNNAHRRQQSQGPTAIPLPPQMQEQLLPLLTRLGPLLPQIPHILTRLRTLAALHASASDFQETMNSLAEEQQRVHDSLTEIQSAVGAMESVIDENRTVVKENVTGLESRIDTLSRRLEELIRTT